MVLREEARSLIFIWSCGQRKRAVVSSAQAERDWPREEAGERGAQDRVGEGARWGGGGGDSLGWWAATVLARLGRPPFPLLDTGVFLCRPSFQFSPVLVA